MRNNIVILTAVYNDWESLLSLIPEIDREIGKIPAASADIVVVDDGSQAPCPVDLFRALKLQKIQQIDLITLTRNLGNQRALAIGMGYVGRRKSHDYVVVMDADHEDNPGYIPVFFSESQARQDSSVIFGERTKRSENVFFRVFYKLYRVIYAAMTGQSIKVGNFCMIPATIAHRIGHLPELWNHFAAAIMKSRIPMASIPTVRGVRRSGRSDMNFVSLVAHAFNGFSVFSEIVAIRLIVFLAIFATIIVLIGATLVGIRFFTALGMAGWTSTMLALFGVILAQVLTTAVLVLFTMLSLKTQRPMIPAVDFQWFVEEVKTVYPELKPQQLS